jgi:hypothetical protein
MRDSINRSKNRIELDSRIPEIKWNPQRREPTSQGKSGIAIGGINSKWVPKRRPEIDGEDTTEVLTKNQWIVGEEHSELAPDTPTVERTPKSKLDPIGKLGRKSEDKTQGQRGKT